MTTYFSEMYFKIMRLLFSSHCMICQNAVINNNNNNDDDNICADCSSNWQKAGHLCKHCGIRLPIEISCCVKCLSIDPCIDSLIIPFKYQGSIKQLIIKLKFNKKPLAATVLASLIPADLLSNVLKFDNLGDISMVIPIPIDRFRLAGRGFNQALEITYALMQTQSLFTQAQIKLLNINKLSNLSNLINSSNPSNLKNQKNQKNQLNLDLLHKKIGYIPQSTLNKSERQRNLNGAFKLNLKQISQIPHTVLLIDDVFTTGSTLFACAQILKDAGVKQVIAFALAKA